MGDATCEFISECSSSETQDKELVSHSIYSRALIASNLDRSTVRSTKLPRSRKADNLLQSINGSFDHYDQQRNARRLVWLILVGATTPTRCTFVVSQSD